MRGFFLFALLLCLGPLGACARAVRVEVNAVSSPQAGGLAGKRCIVLPANPDTRPDDLFFREFAEKTAASLARRGCDRVDFTEDADIAVLLGYGISEPVIVERRDYVIYRPWGRWSRDIPEFIPVVTTMIFNTGGLSLEARTVEKQTVPLPDQPSKTRKGEPPKQIAQASLGAPLWKVSAEHAGQGIDMRALFPWLLAAAENYYGTDSGQGIVVKVPAEAVTAPPPPPPAMIRKTGE